MKKSILLAIALIFTCSSIYGINNGQINVLAYDLNQQDLDYALGERASEDNLLLVKKWLKAGANPTTKAYRDKTPRQSARINSIKSYLHNAERRWKLIEYIKSGKLTEFKDIIENNPSLKNAKDTREKKSMLHHAIAIMNPEIAKYLIEKGADIKSKNQYGQTAIEIVTKMGIFVTKIKPILPK